MWVCTKIREFATDLKRLKTSLIKNEKTALYLRGTDTFQGTQLFRLPYEMWPKLKGKNLLN